MMRDLLPQLDKIAYLNYAATAPVLRPSAEKMRSLISQSEEPFLLHRNEWFSLLEKARGAVARLLNASQNEIAFVQNTSSGLSLIANAISWEPNDRVLFPADEFPSNRFVWMNLAKKGVCPEPIGPQGSFLKQLQSMDLAGVRLVAISAVSYLDGRRHEIEEIGKFCRAKNILFAIDAIQAVGAIPIDLKTLECDFLTAGGQKWLFGPIGSGFIYIRNELIPKLFVPQVGWASVENIRDFDAEEFSFVAGARRFEPALPDIPAIAALATSIETMDAMGWESIYQRIEQLTDWAAKELVSLQFPLLTPDSRAGILTFEAQNAEAIHKKLLENNIFATQRESQIRISLHAPTTESDLAKFFEVLSGSKAKVLLSPHRQTPQKQTFCKRALVTGAGRGLGAAVAKALEAKGVEVIPLTRSLLDLSIPEQVEAFDPGEIDLLINCAVDTEADLFHESDEKTSRKSFEVNFWAPLTLAKQVIPGMIRKKSGTIVNIVTAGARCALPLFSIYSASKGALWSWSESLGRELKAKGIDVITFIPPHMDSTTALRLARKALSFYKIGKQEPQVDADEVAKLVLAAIEKKSSFHCPWKTRAKLAWNQFFPSSIAKKIQKIFHP